MPFCYALTKPLGVPAYTVGFGLSVPKLFSYPLKKELFKKSTDFLNSSFYYNFLTTTVSAIPLELTCIKVILLPYSALGSAIISLIPAFSTVSPS